jgi:hypothetical protein
MTRLPVLPLVRILVPARIQTAMAGRMTRRFAGVLTLGTLTLSRRVRFLRVRRKKRRRKMPGLVVLLLFALSRWSCLRLS